MKYDIIIGATLQQLQERTAAKVADGWQLDGQIILRELKPRQNDDNKIEQLTVSFSQITKKSHRTAVIRKR